MEAVIIVCDRGDGKPATESIRFTLSGRNLQLDLCERHLRELAAGAHPVKRGRQRALNGSKSSAKKSTGKRRGRPPGSKNKPKK
jgi:hypothetical protein